MARIARIEGKALMQVWTDGNAVVRVEGKGAHKLLLLGAEENLRTWRFFPHKPTSFVVTFEYQLEKEEVAGFVNPSVMMELPTSVRIKTKLHPVEMQVSR